MRIDAYTDGRRRTVDEAWQPGDVVTWKDGTLWTVARRVPQPDYAEYGGVNVYLRPLAVGGGTFYLIVGEYLGVPHA